jgi:preprotein translocase subunit SecG
MTFLIALLTVVLVLDCLFLVLLVLIQLPKKEAGMGQAFGGAATDALFGAGSGNALTKVTKWAAGIFFVLAILLTILGNYATSRRGSNFQNLINKAPAATTPPPAVAPTNAAPATSAPAIKLDLPPPPATTTTPAGNTPVPPVNPAK